MLCGFSGSQRNIAEPVDLVTNIIHIFGYYDIYGYAILRITDYFLVYPQFKVTINFLEPAFKLPGWPQLF